MIKINDELRKLVEENAIALATVDESGKPHCVAVAFVKVATDHQVLITDNHMVATRNNIKKNNNVALVGWNKEWQNNCTGYLLKGVAEYFTKGRWYEKVKSMPENKDEPCKGAILVTVNKIKKLA